MNWTIEWMRCLPQVGQHTDYVIECGWRCSDTQNNYSGAVYASCSFTVDENTPNGYTPYDQLTEQQVLGWCWANGVDKTATEAAVAKQIQDQIDPPVLQPPLPWA